MEVTLTKIKVILKTLKCSFYLIFKSSGFLFIPYIILAFLGSSIPLFNSFVFKYFLDSLLKENVDIAISLTYVALYIILILIGYALSSVKTIINNSIFKKAEHFYDLDLFQKLSELPLSLIDTSEGKNMVDDVRNAKDTVVYLVERIIDIASLIYSFFVAFITLLSFDVSILCIYLLFTIPGIILDYVFDKKSENLRLKSAPDMRKLCYYRWMLTNIWPSKDVRTYDLTEPIKKRYTNERSIYIDAHKLLAKKHLKYVLLFELVTRSGEIVFTVYSLICVLKGHIGVGDFTLFVSLALTASDSFKKIVTSLTVNYSRTVREMSRFFDFMSIKTKGKKGKKIDHFSSIVFKDVYFKYPSTDKYILSGANFSINKGEKISIIGINGSGKSTIIKLLLGFYEINSGKILINDEPIENYDINDVRKLFSVLFQEFVKYPMTLRENVGLSNIDYIDDDDQLKNSLINSGAYNDVKTKLNDGLDTYMTRQFEDEGVELSKGQWQKIALARAYFKNSPVVIFDEPSAALDAEAEEKIFENFAAISKGKTSIMISHRISSARSSDKIIVLDHGQIVESGSHEELVENNGLYSRLYNLQKKKYGMKEGESN